jgi:branched-chain amino acid transport system ATP-binding protein
MGVVHPSGGSIKYNGRNLLTLKPWARAGLGISILPENRRLFDDMTVEENLMTAAEAKKKGLNREKIGDTYATFSTLSSRRNAPARVLSGGERQMLALARLAQQSPNLALLDDPFAGLDARMTKLSMNFLRKTFKTFVIAMPEVNEDAMASLQVSQIINLQGNCRSREIG